MGEVTFPLRNFLFNIRLDRCLMHKQSSKDWFGSHFLSFVLLSSILRMQLHRGTLIRTWWEHKWPVSSVFHTPGDKPPRMHFSLHQFTLKSHFVQLHYFPHPVLILLTSHLFLPIMAGAPSVTTRLTFWNDNPCSWNTPSSLQNTIASVLLPSSAIKACSSSLKSFAIKIPYKNAHLGNVSIVGGLINSQQ